MGERGTTSDGGGKEKKRKEKELKKGKKGSGQTSIRTKK